jgi:hypothetical protein
MKEFDMLIIGGGPSTRNAVKIMRQLKPDVTSAVIRYDKTMINHCAMPYALEGKVTLDKIIISDQRLSNWKVHGQRLKKPDRIFSNVKIRGCAKTNTVSGKCISAVAL